jgi:large subunit ribosomal protein L10
MAHPRPEKVAEVQDLERQLRSSPVVILTDYRGLTVSEIGALRGRLRAASLEYRVAKNTLLTRAARQAGVDGLVAFLNGPTAIVFGRDDPGAPARVLQEFIRQYRKLSIKGGVVEGQALDAQAVQSLATLPTRTELLARVVGLVQAPLRGLVGVLAEPSRQLVTALDALRRQRESGEAVSPSEVVSPQETGEPVREVAPAASQPQT